MLVAADKPIKVSDIPDWLEPTEIQFQGAQSDRATILLQPRLASDAVRNLPVGATSLESAIKIGPSADAVPVDETHVPLRLENVRWQLSTSTGYLDFSTLPGLQTDAVFRLICAGLPVAIPEQATISLAAEAQNPWAATCVHASVMEIQDETVTARLSLDPAHWPAAAAQPCCRYSVVGGKPVVAQPISVRFTPPEKESGGATAAMQLPAKTLTYAGIAAGGLVVLVIAVALMRRKRTADSETSCTLV